MVLVSGYAGIGKSSIVNELHKVLVPQRGLFAAGKFDQYKRDIPYARWPRPFRAWCVSCSARMMRSSQSGDTRCWQRLGQNGQLMVNLIPELALVIGEQPPVQQVDPQSAQARFHLVFCSLLGVFANPKHPLVLFIDDLQWLDAATLALLQRLVTDPEVRHLMLIGAYRDNEVSKGHPLSSTLAAIRRPEAPFPKSRSVHCKSAIWHSSAPTRSHTDVATSDPAGRAGVREDRRKSVLCPSVHQGPGG